MKFESADIEIKMGKKLPLSEVAALYREAGWFAPEVPDSDVTPILDGTFAVCGAFLNGKLIGMMRALSDGVSDAYLLDLVVLKAYRRHGIGKRILDHLVGYLHALGVDWTVCIGAPGTESFYLHSSGKTMEGFTPIRFYQETILDQAPDQTTGTSPKAYR